MVAFHLQSIPAPTQDDFRYWLETNNLTWRNLDTNEKNYVQNLFQKQRKQDYEQRIKKIKPILTKSLIVGKPAQSSHAGHVQNNVHQRVMTQLRKMSEHNPGMRIFLDVASPMRSGNIPIIVSNGQTLTLLDIRMWDVSQRYSISESYKVLCNGEFFPAGSVALPLMVQAWRKVLPKGTKVQGLIVFPYGEALVDPAVNNVRPPYAITDLMGTVARIEKIANSSDSKTRDMVDLISAVEISGRLNP